MPEPGRTGGGAAQDLSITPPPGRNQWRLPNAVVRISFELTPPQTEEYVAMFEQLVPGEMELHG